MVCSRDMGYLDVSNLCLINDLTVTEHFEAIWLSLFFLNKLSY